MLQKSIEDLEGNIGRKLVVDIRRAEEYDRDTYPGAVSMPWTGEEDFLESYRDRLPADAPVYLFCRSGQKSLELAEDLQEAGIEAYSIAGGYRAWLRVNLQNHRADAPDAGKICAEIERSIVKKFRKEIWRKFTRAINEYELVEDGDRIAVCISGGKDSMLLAKLFQELERHGRKNFQLVFLVMDPGYNEENAQAVRNNARLLQVPIHVFSSDIFDVVTDIKDSPCYLCARMRRGHLYAQARALGCNKIALGHHFDDVIETILMGMLYGGQVQTMMPKLHSSNFPGMELIRPLYLVREADIRHWRDYNKLHFIQCACRFTDACSLEGGTEQGSKRAEVKALIRDLAAKNPYIEKNIFRSVENVNLKTIIAYKENGVKHHFLESYAQGGNPPADPLAEGFGLKLDAGMQEEMGAGPQTAEPKEADGKHLKTEKLYDDRPYDRVFTARILSVEERDQGLALVLDRTLFFPEEGGQNADRGSLRVIAGEGSAVPDWEVTDVQIRDGLICHYVKTDPSRADAPALRPGMQVEGIIDWAMRFSNMQNHTGEHIISGLIHAKYGYDNVGFHLSPNIVTLDQSGPLSADQMEEIEHLANQVVWANLPVTARYYGPEEAGKKTYRSKIEIDGDVRLVTIGSQRADEGQQLALADRPLGEDQLAIAGRSAGETQASAFGIVDVCACCAPHVARTGEIGLIKILKSEHYKGGTRLTILCGSRALAEVRKRQAQVEQISRKLKAPQDQVQTAVEHLLDEHAAGKDRMIRMQEERIKSLARAAVPDAAGNIWLFADQLDPLPHRKLTNLLVEKCPGYAGVFLAAEDGERPDTWRFIIGSRQLDSRLAAARLREAFGAKGGGKPEMVQGTVAAGQEDLVGALERG